MMTSLYAEKKTRKAEKKTCTANVAACGCIRKQQDFHSGRGVAGLGLGAAGVREASSKIGLSPSFSAIFDDVFRNYAERVQMYPHISARGRMPS